MRFRCKWNTPEPPYLLVIPQCSVQKAASSFSMCKRTREGETEFILVWVFAHFPFVSLMQRMWCLKSQYSRDATLGIKALLCACHLKWQTLNWNVSVFTSKHAGFRVCYRRIYYSYHHDRFCSTLPLFFSLSLAPSNDGHSHQQYQWSDCNRHIIQHGLSKGLVQELPANWNTHQRQCLLKTPRDPMGSSHGHRSIHHHCCARAGCLWCLLFYAYFERRDPAHETGIWQASGRDKPATATCSYRIAQQHAQ